MTARLRRLGTLLKKAVHSGIAGVLMVLCIGAPSGVLAQETPDAEEQATTEVAAPDTAAPAETPPSVEVTGLRLRRTDYETAQPVLTITREDLERTGKTDINEILCHLLTC